VNRIKLVTYNVNGITHRAGEIQDIVNSAKPDIIALQELKLNEKLDTFNGYQSIEAIIPVTNKKVSRGGVGACISIQSGKHTN
jgi:exonuclease III